MVEMAELRNDRSRYIESAPGQCNSDLLVYVIFFISLTRCPLLGKRSLDLHNSQSGVMANRINLPM